MLGSTAPRRASLRLELEGYDLTEVPSLAEALQHVRNGLIVDPLISDYHLNDGETGMPINAEKLLTLLRALLAA